VPSSGQALLVSFLTYPNIQTITIIFLISLGRFFKYIVDLAQILVGDKRLNMQQKCTL
jgi:hypothetical protein